MGQEEIIKYLEREMVASINDMIEFMEEECSAMAVHKAVGKLVKHNEIIRFNIGAGQQRRCFYCVPEVKNIEVVQ